MFIFRSFLCTVQDMVPGGGVEGLGEGLDTQALRVPPLWEMATVRSSTIWVISVDPDATDTVRRMKTIALFKILFLMVLSCLLKVSDAAVPDMQWRNNPVMVAKSGHVMGRDTEVVVGKDRELFHFSIDLKWLCRKIASKTTWNSIFAMVADKVKMMHPGYQCELSYRDSALKCLMSISEFHPQPSVRVFQNSLHTATALAALRGKLVLMYVEEDRPEGMAPSARTLEARKALSDSKLGDFINEEFVFLACGSTHPYASAVVNLLRHQLSERSVSMLHIDYPLLFVLIPNSDGEDHGLLTDIIDGVSDAFSSLGRLFYAPSNSGSLPENKVLGADWGWTRGWQNGALVMPLDLVASMRLYDERVTTNAIYSYLRTAIAHATELLRSRQSVFEGVNESDHDPNDQ